MSKLKLKFFSGVSALMAAGLAHAQTSMDVSDKWNVESPSPDHSIAQVITNEGTWIDVEVSPDGSTIAFSLLGDIYTLPPSGGVATNISPGVAWETQPRFSPDGATIAFTSDRGGGDNIWVMEKNGSNRRQVTSEDFRTVNSPTWSADGRQIAVRKHFTTNRSLGTGEIWLYSKDGGKGTAVVERPSEQHQKELGEPAFGGNGTHIYYSRDASPGAVFDYAQDSGVGAFVIERKNLLTGAVEQVAGGFGGAVRPTPSPDESKLAFVSRKNGTSVLVIKDMISGEDRVMHALDRDMQENWAIAGVYPNLSWTPDGKSVLFWTAGKIHRIDAQTKQSEIIPFSVRDTRTVFRSPHPTTVVGERAFTPRMVRFAALSADERTIAYEMLGRVWVRHAGKADQPISPVNERALHPSFSRDGRYLVYVSWTDEELGHIVLRDMENGKTRRLTSAGGHYGNPRFSPRGDFVVFEKLTGGRLTDPRGGTEPGIYRVSLDGKHLRLVTRGYSRPHYGSDSERIFMMGREGGETTLTSMGTDGSQPRVHAKGALASELEVDPTGRYVMFQENYRAHVTELPIGGATVKLAADMTAFPVAAASELWTSFPKWSATGSHLTWSQGNSVIAAPMMAWPQVRGDQKTEWKVTKEVTAPVPQQRLALIGARILTMSGEDRRVIEDGVILIADDRIVAVGSKAEVEIPDGYRSLDMSGSVIMPGIIDAHAHGPAGERGLIPQQNWSYQQALALGVTTIHDPANDSGEIFAAAELQKSGNLLAPRIYSSGDTIYGARSPGSFAEISSFNDALVHVRRLKAEGALSVKNYNQPRREQRQQIIEAARREKIMVVAEGGAQVGLGLTHLIDGNSTLEHNLPVDRLYDDVLQIFEQTDTNYTPTIVVTFGGLAGDPYWRQATDITEQPLLRAHTPPEALRAAGTRRVKAPDASFVDDEAAREALRIGDKGALVAIGGHGQQAGISPHWDIWSLVRGGASPSRALAAATIDAARSLGLHKDLGSIEVGKLADLAILDADPLADISNTQRVTKVMLGGRLYDAATLNEVGGPKRAPYWWENSEN